MNKIMDCLNPTAYYGWLIENIHFLVLVLLHRLLRTSPRRALYQTLYLQIVNPNVNPCSAFSVGWVSSTNSRLSWHTINEDSMSIIIFMKMQKNLNAFAHIDHCACTHKYLRTCFFFAFNASKIMFVHFS